MSAISATAISARPLLALALLAATPAFAKEALPSLELSESFLATAQQAQAGLAAGTAGGLIPSLRSAAQTPQEKYVAGQIALEYASGRNDISGMRNALADILQSGQGQPKDLPRLWYLSGYYAYVAGDYDNAQTALANAQRLGYSDPELTLMTGDILARKRKPADALPLVLQALDQQAQAGKPITQDNYDRAISIAYQAGKWDQVSRLYQRRLSQFPGAPEWRTALANALAAPTMDDHERLDLYRLMAATGALASERDYEAYAKVAADRGNQGEVKTVVEAGQSAGDLTTGNPVTSKLLKTAKAKATKELAALPAAAKKAASASTGKPALEAAEGYFANGQYSEAVPLFRTALTKGGVDAAQANTHLGIALARSGDLAGGKAALAQVPDGDWGRVAGFWSVWIDQQTKKLGAAPPVVPTLAS